MTNAGIRSVLALIAVVWFLVMGATLGSGYPVSMGGGPGEISDTTARAMVDIGRALLVGLAILSACLVDAGWLKSVAGRLGDWLGPRS